eukprot:CAMPEP_0171963710 /NCGR_PEP_ID=MMETSP0993-20121228/177322_1 /TAXON_ID=483369 /ORGANISM="non described non described, Strain CCMP2098" /LENGTH=30 /DNA_ID= /DNA_START= /DNA_END= /DNA_ORIENTATION=
MPTRMSPALTPLEADTNDAFATARRPSAAR